MTAGDDTQRQAFDSQIQAKLNRGEIPRNVDYMVYSDPPGPRAGIAYALWYHYGGRLLG